MTVASAPEGPVQTVVEAPELVSRAIVTTTRFLFDEPRPTVVAESRTLATTALQVWELVYAFTLP